MGAPRPRRAAHDAARGPGQVTRLLVTGAGGPAAIAAMRSLGADPTVELLAADMDPWASGLYLLPPESRTLIPPGAAPGFTDALLARCLELDVQVVLPTVDAELRPLGRARATFQAHGIELLLAPTAALDVILDKLALAEHCAGLGPRAADRAARAGHRPGVLGLPGHRQAAVGQRVTRDHEGWLGRGTRGA